ncbi:MAG: LCP family protein [Acidimicrobiia bacterium]
MKRLIAYLVVLSLVAVACSGDAEPTTTTTSLPPTTTSTTTTIPTTTTTIPTTTTTLAKPQVDGTDPELAALIESLYAIPTDSTAPAAPEPVLAAFTDAEGAPPATGVATVAPWDNETRLAVVLADKDVTLAVADPTWRVVGGWWPSMGVGQMLGSFPKIVAVVGSDARPDERRDATRADSIHLVGLDGKGNAGIVGIPRDSWVPIPGAGTSKINASLAFGGPEMMMDTFVELTDLDFDGYVLTGFAGFESLIEILGGLKIDVPRSFNDKAAKAYLDAGEQILDGAQALAMSRARKTMPRGDFTRQEHGGLVIMAAQAMIRAAGIESLPALVGNSRPFVSTNFDPGELLVLAAAVRRVDPDNVVNKVAAGGTGSAGGASVVFLRDSAAELWEDLADGKLETGD